MHARPDDWLVIKGRRVDNPEQKGLILEVHSEDGTPPYLVRWLSDGHLSTVFPGSDAVIVAGEASHAGH